MTELQNINIDTNRKKRFFFWFAILIILAVTTISIYFCLDLVIDKSKNITAKTDEVFAITKQLQTKYDELLTNLQELQKQTQKVNATKIKYWKPLVIEHLVHMADLTLNTTGDTKLALSFLSEARQYANDSELSAINHALNKDIANLQVVPTIDASELILKIEAINQKINSLSIVTLEFINPQKKKIEENKITQTETLWQRFFTNTINALKDIVIIRHQTTDPLPSPEQENILRLEIQAKLLQAELAIMQRQNKLYQACLEQILNWISRYFVANQPVTTNILSSLKELQSIDLQPKIPFPTESIMAITNFININKLLDEKPVETTKLT